MTVETSHPEWFKGSGEWNAAEPYGSTVCNWCGHREQWLLVRFPSIGHIQTPWTPAFNHPDFDKKQQPIKSKGWLLNDIGCLGEASASYFVKLFLGNEPVWSTRDLLVQHVHLLRKQLSAEQKKENVQFERGASCKASEFNKYLALIKHFSVKCSEYCWKCESLHH